MSQEKKIRLVKVVVQPTFVIDDGKSLKEVDPQTVVIPAEEWPTYSSERFPREVEKWQEKLNSEDDDEGTERSS
jgi:hypothetical protein